MENIQALYLIRKQEPNQGESLAVLSKKALHNRDDLEFQSLTSSKSRWKLEKVNDDLHAFWIKKNPFFPFSTLMWNLLIE